MPTAPEIQSDVEIERLIVKALKKRKGKATLADVVVDTGLPQLEAERILRKMIGKFACHLEVTEDGEILYEFEPSMRRLDAKERRRERWRAVGAKVWAGFAAVMKAMIAVVMVLYVVLFVVLMVAAMVAASRGGSDNNRRSNRHGPGGGFWFWYLIFGRPNDPYRRHQRHNPRYGRYSRDGKDKDERPFYMKVFSFVLGPDKGDLEPLEEDLALLALVRERQGAVAPAEVAAHTGWSLAQSEQALTKMVARYEGNIAIDDEDGRLVYTFASLLRTAGAGQPREKVPFFWDRWEQRLPLTGNEPGANTLIACLNTFNLGAAALSPTMILPQLNMVGSDAALIGLHYFPLAFSSVIFLLPLLRWLLHVRPSNQRRRQRNMRRGVYRTTFEAVRGGTIWLPTGQLAERAQQALDKKAYLPNVTVVSLAQAVDRIAPELGGDFKSPEGEEITEELGWRFDVLAADLTAAAMIRRQLDHPDAVVKVAFSTRDEEVEQAASEARS